MCSECSHPVDCHGRHLTQDWNVLSEQLWSIKVDETNLLCSRVQPVEFLCAEVDDECCRWDKTLSRRHKHCAIVSWQVWSFDLSTAASTVTPEQVAVKGIHRITGHYTIHCNLTTKSWPTADKPRDACAKRSAVFVFVIRRLVHAIAYCKLSENTLIRVFLRFS